MKGDYIEVNKAGLDRVQRMLRGEFDNVEPKNADAVVGDEPVSERNPPMKKKAGQQKTLPGMQEEVPAEVQQAADDYAGSLAGKAKAMGKFNTARDNLIAAMESNNVPKVRVTYKQSEKIIELQNLKKLKLRKPAPPPTVGDDGEDEGDED